MYIYYIFFIHLSVNGHLGPFYILIIVNSAAMNKGVHIFCLAYQAPLSMGFSRQEYWNGLPFPSTGDLPDPGIEPGSPAL